MSMGIIKEGAYIRTAGLGGGGSGGESVTPVDRVELNNMDSVTSNAVARALANIPTGAGITPIDSIDLTPATCKPENVGKFYILKNTLTDIDLSQDGDEWEQLTAGAILQLLYDEEGEYYYYAVLYSYDTMMNNIKWQAVQKSSPVYNSTARDMTSTVNTAMQNNSSFTIPPNCVLYISYCAENGSDTYVTVNGVTVAEIQSANYANGTLTLIGGRSGHTCSLNCVENDRLKCYKAVAVYKLSET